jgi:RNA polymerase sigma-70 factor (sigma-E family)
MGTTHIVLPTGREAAVRRASTRHLGVGADAFADAITDHHRDLARFAYRLCGNRSQAEDVVAEAYARVWPQWRRGRVESVRPYLMRTIANEVYSQHRRTVLRRREEGPPPRPVDDPFEGQVDERDALWTALARLPQRQRVVVVLRIVEDLSEEQTASMLGVPPGTVKSRLARALATLRTTVEAVND